MPLSIPWSAPDWSVEDSTRTSRSADRTAGVEVVTHCEMFRLSPSGTTDLHHEIVGAVESDTAVAIDLKITMPLSDDPRQPVMRMATMRRFIEMRTVWWRSLARCVVRSEVGGECSQPL